MKMGRSQKNYVVGYAGGNQSIVYGMNTTGGVTYINRMTYRQAQQQAKKLHGTARKVILQLVEVE